MALQGAQCSKKAPVLLGCLEGPSILSPSQPFCLPRNNHHGQAKEAEQEGQPLQTLQHSEEGARRAASGRGDWRGCIKGGCTAGSKPAGLFLHSKWDTIAAMHSSHPGTPLPARTASVEWVVVALVPCHSVCLPLISRCSTAFTTSPFPFPSAHSAVLAGQGSREKGQEAVKE